MSTSPYRGASGTIASPAGYIPGGFPRAQCIVVPSINAIWSEQIEPEARVGGVFFGDRLQQGLKGVYSVFQGIFQGYGAPSLVRPGTKGDI
ncbi:hypothetical protein WJX77_012330 [Trebouxia sp. C0004]